MKIPVMLLPLVVLATGPAFSLGRDSQDSGSVWDTLPRNEDKLCRSCSWRSQEHVTCSHIFAVDDDMHTCRDLHGKADYIPSLPAAPEDIQVTFEGGMNIQWNAGTPNLDKLEGFYVKVWNLHSQTAQCRLFDLRDLNITVEDIQRTNFQYSCFPPDFVEANTQYRVTIQSIPLHNQAEKTFTSPPESIIASSTEPPAQSVLAWKPHRVDVSPSKGELGVSFAAAPEHLGVLTYQIQLMDADNSMTREITAAQTNNMVSVVFRDLCKHDASLPVGIVIQAAAEDGEGGCLCAPDGDFIARTAPCRHQCPRRYYPVSITHSEVCNNAGPAGNRANVGISKETIAAAATSATILFTVLICIGVLIHRHKKPCYKAINLVWSGAYEQEEIMNFLEEYFDSLGLNVGQLKLSNFHDDDKPLPGVLYIMVPPSEGTAQHDGYSRFVETFSPIAIHLEGSLRLQVGPLMFNLPDQRPGLLEHIQGWPRCGKKLRSTDTMDNLEQQIKQSYKFPNPIPNNKDSGYVPSDYTSVSQINVPRATEEDNKTLKEYSRC